MPTTWQNSTCRSMATGGFSLPTYPRRCRGISSLQTSRMASGAPSMCQATGRWRVTATRCSAMWLLRSRQILPMCQGNTTPLALIGKRLSCPRHGKDSKYSCEWRRLKVLRSSGSMGNRWDIMRVDRNPQNTMSHPTCDRAKTLLRYVC